MRTVCFAIVLISGIMVPAFARASLELGTTSAVAVNAESKHWSVGVGLGLRWEVRRNELAVSVTDSFPSFHIADVTLIVLEPAVAARFFLTTNRDAQPFIVARVRREIPIASSDSREIAEEIEDQFDAWQFGLGAGIRSQVSDRFAIGGEVVARTELRSFDGQRTDVMGATDFLVYLQYHP